MRLWYVEDSRDVTRQPGLSYETEAFQLPASTLQRTKTENSKQIFPEKELLGNSPSFHTHVSVSDLYTYFHDRSAYSAAVDQSWEYINPLTGTKAAQFPKKEYIYGIFVTV